MAGDPGPASGAHSNVDRGGGAGAESSRAVAAAFRGQDGVSLVIPAWNEEARLPTTLREYVPQLESFGLPFEVLVVVDGATDRTAAVANAYAHRGVRVFEFQHRLGKGGALTEGFRRARYSVVGFVDADAPVTPDDLTSLLVRLGDHDGAVASRWHPLSNRRGSQPLSRLLLSKSWNTLTRIVLGLRVRDSQCGAKFFRRDAVLRVLPRVTMSSWAFDACLLFHLQRSGSTIAEVPVNWKDDPDSKLPVVRVVPAMLLALVGIRLMSLPWFPRPTRWTASWLSRHLA